MPGQMRLRLLVTPSPASMDSQSSTKATNALARDIYQYECTDVSEMACTTPGSSRGISIRIATITPATASIQPHRKETCLDGPLADALEPHNGSDTGLLHYCYH